MLSSTRYSRRFVWTARLAAVVFTVGVLAVPGVSAAQKNDKASKKVDIVPRVTLSYRQEPLGLVLDYISRASRGVNVKIKAEDADKVEEMRRELVTVELTNVTWKTAVEYIARKHGLTVDDSLEENGIVYVERPPRVTMNVQGARLTQVIKMIAAQADVDIIPGPDVSTIENVSFDLHDVPWRPALESILKTYQLVMVEDETGIIRIVSPTSEQAQHEIKAIPLKYMQPFGTKYRAKLEDSPYVEAASTDSSTGSVGSLLEVLNQIKSPDGTISYERRTNMLVIKDAPTKIEEMVEIIKQLDKEPMQVKVNVRILSYTNTGDDKMGIDWTNGFTMAIEKGVSYQTAFPFTTNNNDSTGVGIDDVGYLSPAVDSTYGPMSIHDAVEAGMANTIGTPGITMGTISFQSLQAILQLSKYSTNVKVVQAPEIIALDNQEATIHVGRVVRYAEFYTETTDGGVVSGYREVEPPIIAGVQLLVIPHICGTDDKIIMEIVPKTEDFNDEWETFGAGTANELRLPKTSSKIVVTKMKLGNRETGVIAGLMNDTVTKTHRKVPFFGDIPIIGQAFNHKSKTTRKENVLVFVTPTILTPQHNEDFQDELEDVRSSAAALGMPSLPVASEEVVE